MPLALIDTQFVADNASPVYLDNARQIASTTIAGVTYVVASNPDGGLTVFSLSKLGLLTEVSSLAFAGGIYGVTFTQVGGVTYLVGAPEGAADLAVFRLDVGGTLTVVEDAFDSNELDGAVFVMSARAGGAAYIIATSRDGGVTALGLAADGALTQTSSVAGGMISADVLTVGGATFVVGSSEAGELRVLALNGSGQLIETGVTGPVGETVVHSAAITVGGQASPARPRSTSTPSTPPASRRSSRPMPSARRPTR